MTDLLDNASPEEQVYMDKLAKVKYAMESPLNFAEVVNPNTVRYAHSECISDHIVALVENRLHRELGIVPEPMELDDPNLMHKIGISCPPQVGKSYVVSEHTPGWYRLRYPEKSVGLAGYEADFARQWGRKNKEHFVEYSNIFDYAVAGATDEWRFVGHRGMMMTAGVGGPMTGYGFRLLIVDDPFKNAEEADSVTMRNKKHDWYVTTFRTRKPLLAEGETPTKEVMMFTRWHEDDLWGRVADDTWYLLVIPAFALEDDILGREEGEALEGADVTDWNDQKTKNPQRFEAMYQGNPVIQGSGIIKRPFQYYRLVEDGTYIQYVDPDGKETLTPINRCRRIASMDTANSIKEKADYSVYVAGYLMPTGQLAVYGLREVKMDSPDLLKQTKEWYDEFDTWMLGIEDKTFGTVLLQNLRREPKYTTIPLKADKDKVTRAIPMGSALSVGHILLPTGAAWIHELENELVKFPDSTHDDRTDAMAYLWQLSQQIPKPRGEVVDKPPEGSIERKLFDHFERIDKKKRTRHHPMLGKM